tara:strand:- start:395 stop:628 length:234 start_codon:yes stop_codon:yes gene_type:complete
MGLRYEVIMTIDVEPTANFLEVEDTEGIENFGVLKELVGDALYDLDDIQVEDLDITRRLDEVYDEDLQSGSREVNYN